MVPVIHRIWAGPPMPDDYEQYGEMWLNLNPGWTVRDWSEEEISAEIWDNEKVIADLYARDAGRRSIELFAQLADVVSYELLSRFGGVYANCDIEPLRPLDELREVYEVTDIWVVHEDDSYVVNAIMAGPKGHPFYRDVVRRLPGRYFGDPGGEMNQTTGPHLLTEVWRKHRIPALPAEAFNAVHWATIPRGETAAGRGVPEGAFGRHHWGHRRDGRTNRVGETPGG